MPVIDKLIEQSPLAAALIALVIIFIRYIKTRDVEFSQTITAIVKANNDRISQVATDFKEHSDRCCTAQEESVKATERNSSTLAEVRKACDRLNESISICQTNQQAWAAMLHPEKKGL